MNCDNNMEAALANASWRYKVVCEDGAFVRTGLELSSRHLYTIPHNSVIDVSERCINNQGLARLRTNDGWISEMLNPLSGQRGPIVEQQSLEVPLKFRVVYAGGALVRSGVELSSSVVGTIPAGSMIIVTDKRFSNTPSYRCVPRLKLGDGSGWISMRINSPPPDDTPVVELLGVAQDGDTGDYNLVIEGFNNGLPLSREQSLDLDMPAMESLTRNNSTSSNSNNNHLNLRRTASSMLRGAEGENSEKVARALSGFRLNMAGDADNNNGLDADTTCLVCFSATRTATFVHGETGHIACCLECARVLKGRGDACPVCRMPIDHVIQHFWA